MQAESVGVEALLSGLLNRKLPGPGTSIAAQNLRFEGSVEAGDEVVASATAREKSPEGRLIVFDCTVRCKGRNLVTGTVTVRAPERRLRYSDVATPEVMLRRTDNFARLLKRCEGSQPVACAVVHPACGHLLPLPRAKDARRRGIILWDDYPGLRPLCVLTPGYYLSPLQGLVWFRSRQLPRCETAAPESSYFAGPPPNMVRMRLMNSCSGSDWRSSARITLAAPAG